MKQIIQSYKTGEMKLEEVPRPQVLHGMVLIETKASVVSAGTERMIVNLAKKSLVGKARERPDLVKRTIATARNQGVINTFRKVKSKLDTPIPLGYSCSGIVRHLGGGVDNLQIGDIVACGGAGYANHAEYNLVPKNLCVKVPLSENDNGDRLHLDFEQAAFATVGAIALQGVRQAALTLGERVCVIGLGLLGQLTVQLCKANGCRVIGSDIDRSKIDLAKKLGADEAVLNGDLEKSVIKFTKGVGADAVILTAAARGSDLIAMAGTISRSKGRVIVVGQVGMDIPRDIYYKKELDLRLSMSYGPGRYDAEYEERGHDYPLPYVRWSEQRNMEAFLELVATGGVDVRSLITHRYSFERALMAYDMITACKEPCLGVTLKYNQNAEPKQILVSNRGNSVSNDQIGLGVIGAGSYAKSTLLPRFRNHPEVKMKAVVSGRGMSAKEAAENFSIAYCSENSEDILADGGVNTVLVATRHNLHGILVEKALSAGKNVFVEKPLCLNWDELERIVQVWSSISESKTSQLPTLMVGFNRRFSPFARRIKSFLEGRSTPALACYRVNAGFVPKASWVQDPEEGGGRIVGEVCHFVDTMRFLVGAPVRTVQAACVQTNDATQTNRDSLAITLTYKDGSLGTIIYHALGCQEYPKEKLEIAADGHIIVMDNYRRLEILGSRKKRMKGRSDKGFDGEVDAFVKAVSAGGPLPIPFSEMVETTMVTFAIHEALNTGQTISMAETEPFSSIHFSI